MRKRIWRLIAGVGQLAFKYKWSYGLLLLLAKYLPELRVHQAEPYPRLLKYIQLLSTIVRECVNNLPAASRAQIARNYLLPLVNLLFERNYVNWAQLMLFSLEEFFLAENTEAGFEDVLKTFSPAAIAAGERFRAAFPLPVCEPQSPARIGFVAPYVGISGYEVVLGLGPRLSAFSGGMYAMRAYNFKDWPSCEAAFSAAGLPLRLADCNFYDVFALRNILQANPVDVAIWPLPPFHMFFLFSWGLAQRQVWFSQYLHPNLQMKHLHAMLTPAGAGQQRQKVLNGRLWDVIPQLSRPFGASAETAPKVLFTPARLEKLKQPEFLKCVADILRGHPGSVFKWTGYYSDQEVVDFFKNEGLADRHYYIPWMSAVELVREIRLSDMLLSCFPLALGTVENIAAYHDVPVVTLYDEEKNLYWRDIYWEASHGNEALRQICFDAQGNSRILIAKTPAEYVQVALRVLNEPELAKIYTEVYRRAFDYTYTNNPNDVSEVLNDFIGRLFDKPQGDKNAVEQEGPDLQQRVV
jgi:hypothetical protein